MHVCTICARGGSKGVPGKNTRLIAGKPLIAHSILQAHESALFDAIAVSSDDEDLLQVAADFGADVLVHRPADLASDVAPKIAAIRHCAEVAEQRLGRVLMYLTDLDATSPLRQPSDIRDAFTLLLDDGASNVISGAPARRSPYFNLVELDRDGRPHLSKEPDDAVFRRQDSPPCFDMNASIYVWRRASLFSSDGLFQERTRLLEMPEERSMDIDSPLDWRIVEMLMNERL